MSTTRYQFTPLKMYNGTHSGVPLEIPGQQLPINELNGTSPNGACPISNLHLCKRHNRMYENVPFSQHSRKMTTTHSRTTTASKSKQMFCNACYKAGKDESLYTNHFPKSIPGPSGVIVCPTILSAYCTYCEKTGHWANEKYCPAIRSSLTKNAQSNRSNSFISPRVAGIWKENGCTKDIQNKNKEEYPDLMSRREPVSTPTPTPRPTNHVSKGGYSALLNNDSDDDESDRTTIGQKRSRTEETYTRVSWASIATIEPALNIENNTSTLYVTQRKDLPREFTPGEKEAFKILEERRREMKQRKREQTNDNWSWAYPSSSDSEDETNDDFETAW